MADWLTIILLIAVVALLVTAVVIVGRLLLQLTSALIASRRALARRTSIEVPGLGQFSSTDGSLWHGIVQDVRISIVTGNEEPTHIQVERIQAIVRDLPVLTDAAKACLAANEDMSWLDHGASAVEPYGICIRTGKDFRLEFAHADDPDGTYWTEFVDGRPVRSGRDD